MKKTLFILMLIFSCAIVNSQKITTLGEASSATSGSLFYIRQGSSGDLIKRITLANLFTSPTFTGTVTLPTPFTIGTVSVTTNGQELNLLDGLLSTSAELNKLVGIGTDTIATRAYSRTAAGGTGIAAGDTSAMLSTYLNNTRFNENSVDLTTVFVKLVSDTVQVTNNKTLELTDASKWLSVVKSTSVVITIPLNSTAAIPIGTTINFTQTGAGIIVFKKVTGVELHSKKDSIATGGVYSWASLYKRGTNNWLLYGDITD